MLRPKEYSRSDSMLPPKLGHKWPDRILILETLSYHIRILDYPETTMLGWPHVSLVES